MLKACVINLLCFHSKFYPEDVIHNELRGPCPQKSTSERDWGLAPVVFSKSPKPGAIALRLDFDLKGRDPTARSEGPVLASGKSLVQA